MLGSPPLVNARMSVDFRDTITGHHELEASVVLWPGLERLRSGQTLGAGGGRRHLSSCRRSVAKPIRAVGDLGAKKAMFHDLSMGKG